MTEMFKPRRKFILVNQQARRGTREVLVSVLSRLKLSLPKLSLSISEGELQYVPSPRPEDVTH